MSDFDKIIRESMDEEEEFFPRKELNWSRLADRLEAYEVANPLPAETTTPLKVSWWRYAAAASVAATLMASGWFYFKMKEFKNENIAIKEELKALKDNQLNADKTQSQPTVVYKTDTLVQRIYVMPKQAELQQTETQQQGVAESSVLNNFNKTNAPKSVEKANKPSQAPMQAQELAANTGVKQGQQNAITPSGNLPKNKAQSTQNEKIELNTGKNTENEIADNTQQSTNINTKADETKTTTGVNIPAVDPSVEIANTTTQGNQTEIKNSAEVVEIQQVKHEFKPVKSLHTQSWADIDLDVKVTPPIVKSRNAGKIWNYLPKGIAIGVNGTLGRNTPIVAGVDPLSGTGVSADLKISRRLSIGFQGDWTSAEFEFKKRPPKFPINFPDTPNHPIHEKLERIEGKINTRMLGINAQYKLTTQNWANPYVTMSYNWIKTTSPKPTFTFKDENTGGQTQRPQAPMAPELTNNLVSVGLGLEKTIGRFTINTVVDFYRDFNKTDYMSKDMIVLRGGVKFQIF